MMSCKLKLAILLPALLALVTNAYVLGPRPSLVGSPVLKTSLPRGRGWVTRPWSLGQSTLNPCTTLSHGMHSRRQRSRSDLIVQQVFGGGGSGFPGGQGPQRGPPGLDPGTLFAVVGGLLLVFAPGVIFGAFNFLFLVAIVGPALLSVGFQIYTKLNTIEAPCPVCGAILQGAKTEQMLLCPSCGSPLEAKNGKFEALGSGYARDEMGRQQEISKNDPNNVIIDVEAIEVED
ncbi:unnamed protein product [Choristocarpus tenellus]